jgi:hypothetical protein
MIAKKANREKIQCPEGFPGTLSCVLTQVGSESYAGV